MEYPLPINNVIVRSPDICWGRPRINGTRLQVYDVISDLEDEKNIDGYCERRGLNKNVLIQAVNYCKKLECQYIEKEYEKYCSGCILSTLHEDYNYKESNYEEIDTDLFMDKARNIIALGNKDEIDQEEFGRPGWVIANEIEII